MIGMTVDENITLKLNQLHNAKEIFELVDSSRSFLREWLPWLDNNLSVLDTEDFIKDYLKKFANNEGAFFSIWYRGQIAGCISLNFIDHRNKSTAIGYWISPEFEGIGIVTKCTEKLAKYAITAYKLKRVEIRCATENHKSRAIPERLGFIHEGTLRDNEYLYGTPVNHEVYSYLAREYYSKVMKQNIPQDINV